MDTPKDFEYLSTAIFRSTQEVVNSFTLKRYWGYIDRGGVSHNTLNILSHYVGCCSWEHFCIMDHANCSGSGFVEGQMLYADELTVGEHLTLEWLPDRLVKARYEGNERFTIVEVQNIKLKAETTFRCHLFINNDVLVLNDVEQDGEAPRNYRCGNGVRYTREKGDQ